ncbi:MAG: hypothetical protein Q9181_003104 [Wetmoreana brouardii]
MPSISDESADSSDASPSATTVGRIEFPDYDPDDVTESTSWMKRVHLYVGPHQRLTGEVKKLPNPLAVIRRKPQSSPSETEQLDIAEVIYYKLLFSARPEPSFALFGLWAIAVSIRNIYLHPLSKFPGPKLAAATPIPFVKNNVSGNMVDWVMGLHAKYGEVVRTGPDELSFITPSAWQDIYATKPQLPKVLKGFFTSYNGVPSIGSHTVPEEHDRQRKILSHAFSERALRSQEDILKHYTDLLITKLKEQIVQTEKTSSVTLDISSWYNYTTFDMIGDLLFNDPFHSLETAADHPRVEAIFTGIKFAVFITSFDRFPPMDTIVKKLMPQSIRDAAEQHFRWSQEKITQRIESGSKRPDFMTYILRNNEGEEKMTRAEIDSTGEFLVLAGSETSATSCTSSTYFMLKNRRVYEKLKTEIRDAFSTADGITVSAAGRLPYLHAVITEALRLHPLQPISVPRLVDRPGVQVSGYDVPVGVGSQGTALVLGVNKLTTLDACWGLTENNVSLPNQLHRT